MKPRDETKIDKASIYTKIKKFNIVIDRFFEYFQLNIFTNHNLPYGLVMTLDRNMRAHIVQEIDVNCHG